MFGPGYSACRERLARKSSRPRRIIPRPRLCLTRRFLDTPPAPDSPFAATNQLLIHKSTEIRTRSSFSVSERDRLASTDCAWAFLLIGKREFIDRVTEGVVAVGEPGLERRLRPALHHVQQPCWASAIADRGEVDDDGDVLVATPGVAPDVLIDANDLHALTPRGVVDQQPLAFSQDRVVGYVQRDPESLGDTGDGEVCDHDPFRRPPQPGARELRAWLRRGAGVLAPHVSAVGTAVAAHYNSQHGRSPAQRLVGQPPDHGVTSSAFAAAPSAPLIWFHHAAREDRTIRFTSLSGHAQTEAVESSEGGQVRAAEGGRRGSVGHVEVFRMDGVGTSVVGRP